MSETQVLTAIKQICDEKGIALESVFETIEAALAAAYRKDFGNKMQNIKVEFDRETADFKVFDIKEVVEDQPEEEESFDPSQDLREETEDKSFDSAQDKEDEKAKAEKKKDKEKSASGGSLPADRHGTVGGKEKKATKDKKEGEEEVKKFNPKTQIQITEAKVIKKSYKLGDIIKTKLKVPGDFGRMAAQTAKQVITQKIREAERETLYNEFKAKEGEILMATVQRREGRVILIDLGKLTGVIPPEEQIESERYSPGDHVKVYVLSVTQTTKGPEVIISRSHPNIIRKLFELEIPEIAAGTVEIKGISREAGYRSKVAVTTDQESIDPIGSCIGQRGARVHTIISELKGEKIDIILFDEDPVIFIKNALSPAKILDIKTNEEEKSAIATVAEDQLSLAIGKAGQNVRLAAKLTGWKIDIVTDKGEKVTSDDKTKDEKKEKDSKEGKKEKTDEKKEDKKTKDDKKKDKEKNNAKDDKEDKKKKTKKTDEKAEKKEDKDDKKKEVKKDKKEKKAKEEKADKKEDEKKDKEEKSKDKK